MQKIGSAPMLKSINHYVVFRCWEQQSASDLTSLRRIWNVVISWWSSNGQSDL